MTPTSPSSPGVLANASLKSTIRSPPPKRPGRGMAPPLPPPPPPPTVVPGPNAFAQMSPREAEQRAGTTPSTDQASPASDGQDSVLDLYSDKDQDVLSPMVERHSSQKKVSLRRQDSHSGRSSTSYTDNSYANNPWSASAYSSQDNSPDNVFWSGNLAARSQFFQQMRQTRARLDGNMETQQAQRPAHSPPEVMKERLKLVPSPDPDAVPEPTHRAHVDEKNQERLDQERLSQLITTNGSVPSSTPSASAQTKFLGSATPKRNKHSEKTPTTKSSKSPKRGLFNKLGLGVKLFPSEHRTTNGFQESDFTPVRAIPAKAAKLLGARSLPARDRSTVGINVTHSSTGTDERSSLSSEPAGRAFSSSSPKRSDTKSKRDKQNVVVKPEAEEEGTPGSPLRRVKARVSERKSLRYYDDENPPTPPSKPKDFKKLAPIPQIALQHSATEEPEQRHQATSEHDRDQERVTTVARAGRAGYHSGPGLFDSPHIPSMYGTLSDAASVRLSPRSPNHRYSLPEQSPHAKNLEQSRGWLAPIRYDPESPPNNSHWSNTVPHGSPNSLKPFPLRIPSSVRFDRADPSHSFDRTRQTSQSTSASIQIYLDIPQNPISPTDERTLATPTECYLHADSPATEGLTETITASSLSSPTASYVSEMLQQTATEIREHYSSMRNILDSHSDSFEKLKQQVHTSSESSTEYVDCVIRTMGDDIDMIKKAMTALSGEREKEKEASLIVRAEVSGLKDQVAAVVGTLADVRADLTFLAQTKRDGFDAQESRQKSAGTQTDTTTSSHAALHYSTGVPTPPLDSIPSHGTPTDPPRSYTPSPTRRQDALTHPPSALQEASRSPSPQRQQRSADTNTRGYLKSVPQAAETRAEGSWWAKRGEVDEEGSGGGMSKERGGGRERWTN